MREVLVLLAKQPIVIVVNLVVYWCWSNNTVEPVWILVSVMIIVISCAWSYQKKKKYLRSWMLNEYRCFSRSVKIIIHW